MSPPFPFHIIVLRFYLCLQLTTYQGGGSYQNLHYWKNMSKNILKELKENLWIDRGTRSVFVNLSIKGISWEISTIKKIFI